MTDDLPFSNSSEIHVQRFADPVVETDSIVVGAIPRIGEAIAVHVEHVRGRAVSIHVPDFIVSEHNV